MLGDEQERWLFDNLATARARWTLIGQQVFSFARDLAKAAPEGRYAMDKWDGYVGARSRLYARLKDAKTPNPIVISGDVHAHFGAELKQDFADVRAEPIGVEITNSSVSAGADGSDVAADWEATRADNPAHQVPRQPARLHRVHGHAEPDAGGVPVARARDGTRCAGEDRTGVRGGSRCVAAVAGLTRHGLRFSAFSPT